MNLERLLFMFKVGICGHFGHGLEAVGGQTIRTRIIAAELIKVFGEDKILCIDTEGWKKNPIKLVLNCIKASTMCKNVVILPAHNGIKVFIPLFFYLTRLFKKKLHYIVIGAWLADDLSQNKWLIRFTKKIDFIYVQTKTLKEKLSDINISENIHILSNFKLLKATSLSEVVKNNDLPYKTCTLSRVHYMKGIEDAIKVVADINVKYGKKTLSLDIIGPIEYGYEEDFYKLVNQHAAYVSYNGSIQYDKTIDVLRHYHFLMFPTKYYTEGFPGTIVDAFFSGVPVLASRWESYKDIIEDNVTGISYEFNNSKDLFDKACYLIDNPQKVMEMKRNCFIESKKYTADFAMKILLDNLI